MDVAGITVGEKKLRCIILSAVADAPAKCLLMNTVQFNGRYGCPVCYNEGQVAQVSERGHSRVYPFEDSSLRTHEEMRNIGTAVEQSFIDPQPDSGVKGLSVFMKLAHFDIVRAHTIDYMHCVVLGVMRMLLNLWFDSLYSKKEWSVRSSLSRINEALENMKVPSCITRKPRSLDTIVHWKAFEYKNFMLYFSVPLLYGILPKLYFNHYILLVEGIFVLLGSSISQLNLKRAKRILAEFSIQVGELYGERFMTFNVLLHLSDKVKDLGPLWCHNCFFYEDYNGDLRKLFHGTKQVELQIVLAVSSQLKANSIPSRLQVGTEEHVFAKHLTRKSHLTRRRLQISSSMFPVGVLKQFVPEDHIKQAIEAEEGIMVQYNTFYRILLGNRLISSEVYERTQKQLSYAVLLKNGVYALVLCTVYKLDRYVLLRSNQITGIVSQQHFRRRNFVPSHM